MSENTRNPIDAYAPKEIAARVETAGVAKAHLNVLQTIALGFMAGAFIAFGAMYYTVVVTDSGLGFGAERFLGGIAFSLGLVLVVIAGAELFTGNNLIVMAWAEKKVTSRQLLRNWGLVYLANFAGASATAVVVHYSGVLQLNGGGVAKTAVAIASAKADLPFLEAVLRGVLCNALVCLAVWLCMAAHSVSGKILAILFPISAFVALGFEHSVANMYFLPLGMLEGAPFGPADMVGNLLPVSLGNIIGGSGFVALVYWAVYLRPNPPG